MIIITVSLNLKAILNLSEKAARKLTEWSRMKLIAAATGLPSLFFFFGLEGGKKDADFLPQPISLISKPAN